MSSTDRSLFLGRIELEIDKSPADGDYHVDAKPLSELDDQLSQYQSKKPYQFQGNMSREAMHKSPFEVRAFDRLVLTSEFWRGFISSFQQRRYEGPKSLVHILGSHVHACPGICQHSLQYLGVSSPLLHCSDLGA